ncbi:hypothetical protein FRC15_008932 [Serendipita sp. 397]|nr:hypothetical protein FRC15_008932 [Serendipita sp. 397]
MADIYSTLPANSQIFTSKSRPPFGSSMGVLSRHNQMPNAAVALPQPVKIMQKRRRSEDSDDDMEQQSRSRSPSPEKRVIAPARSRKLPLKKIRADPDASIQEKRDGGNGVESDTDVANARVLLANLPLTSYPDMVQALLEKEPSLTKLLISVIPRPTADAAREAIVAATKKLRDAIPYSAASSAAASVPVTTTARSPYSSGGRNSPSMIGNVRNHGGNQSAAPDISTAPSALGLTAGNALGALSFSSSAIGLDLGFGSGTPSLQPNNATSGQRDAYVMSRLRPAVQEFLSTVHAYLPYYSLIPPPVTLANLQQKNTASSPQRPHPDETFTVLASLTNALVSLPANVIVAINEQSTLPERIIKEWSAWLDHLDEAVNKNGEMFSGEQARSWINSLDTFAIGGTLSYSTGPGISGSIGFGTFSNGGPPTAWGGWGSAGFAGGWGSFGPSMPRVSYSNNLPEMKDFRDLWVRKVGWLVGRQPPVPGFEAMDER